MFTINNFVNFNYLKNNKEYDFIKATNDDIEYFNSKYYKFNYNHKHYIQLKNNDFLLQTIYKNNIKNIYLKI